MNILACGTEVILKRSKYEGVITGITIRENRVTYEISYYEGGTYKTNWFCKYEFTVGLDVNTIEIGFNRDTNWMGWLSE